MNVIVHGGAGSEPDEPESCQAVLDEAAEAGVGADTPVDAVREAVGVLETAPRFNAGIGGAIQSDGTIRTDAGIMTDDRETGAACAMPGVAHAVDVAHAVMEDTPHVLLAGERAVEFAADSGIGTDVDLRTDRTRKRWADLAPPEGGPREQLDWIGERFGETPSEDHDTVGAVAANSDSIAAATSTGGRWLALAGRVGDVPQIGSGFYCAPAGGASATGAGEDIARVTLSRRAVGFLEEGASAQQAADRAIEEFAELTDSTAGIIVCNDDGEMGSSFNSDAMQTKALSTH